MDQSKKVHITNKTDSSELDAAMSELARQTDRLLGETHEKSSPKPKLPKKDRASKLRGKSFDIVNHNHKPTRLISVLKTADRHSKADTSANISSHKSKLVVADTLARQPISASAQRNTELKRPEPQYQKSNPTDGINFMTEDSETKENNTQPIISLPASHKGQAEVASMTGAKNKQAAELHDEPDKKSDENIDLKETITPQTDVEPTEEATPEEPKGIFDTSQYHPELHDWSKLDHSSNRLWLIALVLVVVCGGVAYYVFLNLK